MPIALSHSWFDSRNRPSTHSCSLCGSWPASEAAWRASDRDFSSFPNWLGGRQLRMDQRMIGFSSNRLDEQVTGAARIQLPQLREALRIKPRGSGVTGNACGYPGHLGAGDIADAELGAKISARLREEGNK